MNWAAARRHKRALLIAIVGAVALLADALILRIVQNFFTARTQEARANAFAETIRRINSETNLVRWCDLAIRSYATTNWSDVPSPDQLRHAKPDEWFWGANYESEFKCFTSSQPAVRVVWGYPRGQWCGLIVFQNPVAGEWRAEVGAIVTPIDDHIVTWYGNRSSH